MLKFLVQRRKPISTSVVLLAFIGFGIAAPAQSYSQAAFWMWVPLLYPLLNWAWDSLENRYFVRVDAIISEVETEWSGGESSMVTAQASDGHVFHQLFPEGDTPAVSGKCVVLYDAEDLGYFSVRIPRNAVLDWLAMALMTLAWGTMLFWSAYRNIQAAPAPVHYQ